MNGLVYDGQLRYRIDLPRPRPAAGEALIRVRAAGICRTDLEIVHGYMGFRGVLGHEFVGEVVAADSGPGPGTRVVGEINAACGACPTCRAGRPRHCPHRTVLGIEGRDGAFADLLTLPVSNLHAVPDGIPDEEAVFVEPLAAAFRILEQVDLPSGTPVVVLGDGRLGHLVALVLADAGARVTLLGRHPDRLERLRDHGLDTGLAPGGSCGTTGGRRFPVAVDCTGTAEGFRSALTITEPTGTLVLKSTFAGATPMNLAPVVIDEVRVIGSRCGPFPPAIAALADRRIRVGELIEEVAPLSDGVRALERARGRLKVLLKPQREAD